MKYYKDENSQVFAYEDSVPEFSSYTEIDVENEDGEIVKQKVYPEFTVKEGLIAITKEEADAILKATQDEINTETCIPQSLSRFQALTVLKLTKINETTNLYQATDAYIKSLSGDTAQDVVIQTAWETASEFRRDSATILMAQKMFNLTDEQVDQMFINGAEITA